MKAVPFSGTAFQAGFGVRANRAVLSRVSSLSPAAVAIRTIEEIAVAQLIHTNLIDSFRGTYRFLSNFWPAEVVYEGTRYASVEHAYQAAKCLHRSEKEMVRTAATPGQAKRLARTVTVRFDWEEIRVGVMRDLVRLKFRTHADLAAMLVATGEARLVEANSWGDTFWGECRGEGQNRLGRILMEVREELRASGPSEPSEPGAAAPSGPRLAV
ncbi:MAG: NADAR family protein [Planctomycetaceae bacterium]|nr:NADAR family protein [Planctomycetaceae bacterium]